MDGPTPGISIRVGLGDEESYLCRLQARPGFTYQERTDIAQAVADLCVDREGVGRLASEVSLHPPAERALRGLRALPGQRSRWLSPTYLPPNHRELGLRVLPKSRPP